MVLIEEMKTVSLKIEDTILKKQNRCFLDFSLLHVMLPFNN